MFRDRSAWIAVYIGLVAGNMSINALDLAGAPDGVIVVVSTAAGVGLGAFWYLRYPRSLAQRLFPITCLLLLFAVFAAFDFQAVKVGPNFVFVGLVAGLVLTEVYAEGKPWGHQKRTALSSKETMRELR